MELTVPPATDANSLLGIPLRLFDWNQVPLYGEFDSIDTTGHLEWDTTDLYVGGTVTLLAVPEPSATALLLASLAVGLRRRRNG